MNIQKYTRTQAIMAIKENIRDHDYCKDRFLKEGQKPFKGCIDPKLSKNNYVVGEQITKEDIAKEYDRIKEETGKVVRKDAKPMCQNMITFPKNIPAAREREFYEHCLNFFKEKVPNGQENVYGITVHKDEPTARTHGSVSILTLQNNKDGIKTFNYGKTINRNFYQNYHKDLTSYIADKMGIIPNLLIDHEKEPIKAILAKTQAPVKKLNQLTKDIERQIQKETKSVRLQAAEANRQLGFLQNKNEKLKEELETRTNQLNYTEAELAKSNQDLKQMSNTILDMRDIVFDETVKHKDWINETGKLKALIKQAWEFGKNRFNEITRAFKQATIRDPELKEELHRRSLKLQAKDRSIQWKDDEIIASRSYQRPSERKHEIGR